MILGANNSGKSTVLQALDLNQLPTVAHRSVVSAPTREAKHLLQPRAVVAVSMTPQQFRQMNGESTWYLPMRANHMEALTTPDLQAGPNQFLHLKALRELLNILAIEGKQHQYILTAHSAEVISAVKASTVTMLTLKDGVTTVRQTDHAGLATLRERFADLGLRATEMHGRDQVLWVEGQTEELVLPALLRHFCVEHAAGTAVLRVQDTGWLDKRGVDPIRVVEIYSRLTLASALVPPMVAVLLDREGRSEPDCTSLEQDRRGRLRFLPSRMLENYLLHPGAITAVLCDMGESVDADRIAQRLCAASHVQNLSDLDTGMVDGANLLKSTFAEISQARHEFRKTRDVPNLVDWLLENEPTVLQPLGDWLQMIMNESAPAAST